MGAKVHVLVYKWTRVLFDLYCGYQNCRPASIGDWGSVEPKIEGPPCPVSVPLDNPFGNSGAMIHYLGVRIRKYVLQAHAHELIEGKPIEPLGLPVCCKGTMVFTGNYPHRDRGKVKEIFTFHWFVELGVWQFRLLHSAICPMEERNLRFFSEPSASLTAFIRNWRKKDLKAWPTVFLL